MNSGCLSIPLGITPQHTSDARAPSFNSNGSRRAIRTACRICFRLPVRGCAYSEWSMTASPHSRHATRPLLLAPPGILQRLPRCPLCRVPRRALPSGSRCTRRRVFHPARVEGRAPASVIVLDQLQVVALAVHPHGHVPNSGLRVPPGAQGMQSTVIRGHRAPGEAECCPQELAALVGHGLLDHLICPVTHYRFAFPLSSARVGANIASISITGRQEAT